MEAREMITTTESYDELTLALQALSGLENLLSGGAHEVDPTSISLLIEPIRARLDNVKTLMKAGLA